MFTEHRYQQLSDLARFVCIQNVDHLHRIVDVEFREEGVEICEGGVTFWEVGN